MRARRRCLSKRTLQNFISDAETSKARDGTYHRVPRRKNDLLAAVVHLYKLLGRQRPRYDYLVHESGPNMSELCNLRGFGRYVLLEPRITHDTVTLLSNVLSPGVLNFVPHRATVCIKMHSRDHHGVGHRRFVRLQTVCLCQAETDVKCALRIFSYSSRGMCAHQANLVFVERCVHDSSISI